MRNNANAVHELARLRLRIHDFNVRYWRRLLGDRLDVMIGSRSETDRALVDPNRRIREGAFSLICLHWGPNPDQEDLYCKAALDDPDELVRATAMPCWVKLFAGTRDQTHSTALARIARDERRTVPLRRAAYIGVFGIQGVELADNALSALLRAKDTMPPDLDWGLVDSLL